MRIARVGGVLILIFNIAAAVYDWRAPGLRSPTALGVDLLNATLGMALFASSFTRWFRNYWRPLVLAACCVLLSGNQLGVNTVSFEDSFVGTLLIMFGAAVLAPWEPRWQAALGAAGLLTFGLTLWQHPGADPNASLHCLGLVTGFAAAQAGVILQRRLRAALSRNLSALEGSHHNLRAAMGLQDATYRKLAQSEATLRKVFEAAPDFLAISRLSDGRLIEVNDRFLRAGFTRGQLASQTIGGIQPFSRESLSAIERDLRRDGSVRDVEMRVARPEGERIWMVSASLAEIDGETCIVSSSRDITDLKVAENQLRYNQAVLRKTFDSVLDPLSLSDFPDGRYLYVNEEFLRATGYPREQVIGKTFHELGIFLEADQERQFLCRLRTRGELRNLEATFRTKAGAAIPVLLSSSVLDLGGERRILSIARDITALKQAHRELEQAREAALEASRSKSAFLSSMSHEIRTPMNAVLGMADILGETGLDADQRRYLDTIVSNGNVLLELINGILDLARIESGRLNLESVAFDLAGLTGKVADTLAARAHEKGLELMVRIAPDLPRAVIGDPLRLQQVLANLIGNAIKFTEQGEVLITVARDPSDSAADGAMLFSVADTGIGIAQDKLGAIFSPFTQADSSTTRKYGGSGLGLSIVQRLVTLMGGRVWAESEPGKGSTLRFTARFNLPDPPNAATAPVPTAPDAAAPLVNELAGRRVLLVDDNATNRTIVREMLAQTGGAVTEADSGRAGLEAIEQARRDGAPFDLIIADDHMPSPEHLPSVDRVNLDALKWRGRPCPRLGEHPPSIDRVELDGIKLIKRARQNSATSRVIMMLTADGLNAALAGMRQAGIEHYLVKPIKRDELYAAIALTMAAHAAPSIDHAPAAVSNGTAQPQPHVLARELRILIADDSADNRLLIRTYLKQTPYQLEEAENGAIAFGKFTDGRFDLVLMDIQMPVLDGYAATRQIRAWEHDHAAPHTPVIALTASALEEDIHRAAEAGCDRHLSKPVKKAALLDAIAQAVN